MISISSLTKDYGRHRALDSVTFEIGRGMFGLLGPNGAGKTTLMRVLTTLLPPSSGRVSVLGMDVQQDKTAVRRVLGYLPQEFGLYRRLSAVEFLELVSGLKEISPARRRGDVERVLRAVNLWDQRHRRLGTYSGRMKRRVGIAQALLGDPRLLVVDEPTAGLDPEERIRLRNLLAELSRDRVVVLSTHIVGDIESACERLAVLNHGRLAFSGDQEGLKALAAGKVWRVHVPEDEFGRLKELGKVVSTRRDGAGLEVRLIGRENPRGMGEELPPTLEDGYMSLMGDLEQDARQDGCQENRQYVAS